ncbi:PREDICTED: cytochrome c oxidase assembly protein COX16 homolog, mitochondrial [Leptosomus discolor]|uniref:cytochrome c oxidase assembly protein COX16 homolog, mitochondrial n=1 Tax=Leptosomus discolor TaxID=188344 RepID=UPI000522D2BA|nr:PREDICTED: cytochrome c oxidase assembly protein COX16 homolog, mitochondrial [Leptosomus discolor]
MQYMLVIFDYSAWWVRTDLENKLREERKSEYKISSKLEKSDLDNWENIRGPRLWEDSRTVQKQRREALRLKTE